MHYSPDFPRFFWVFPRFSVLPCYGVASHFGTEHLGLGHRQTRLLHPEKSWIKPIFILRRRCLIFGHASNTGKIKKISYEFKREMETSKLWQTSPQRVPKRFLAENLRWRRNSHQAIRPNCGQLHRALQVHQAALANARPKPEVIISAKAETNITGIKNANHGLTYHVPIRRRVDGKTFNAMQLMN